MNPADPNSFSQTQFCEVTKLDLDWKIDFKRKIITGTVTARYDNKQTENTVLILDTNKLNIQHVFDQESGKTLEYKLHDEYLSFGSRLDITLPKCGIHSHAVCIEYETTSECQALQWLNEQQTAGKEHPYLFSQCQPIHARTLLPCQDTPLVKCPYSAKVEAPEPLTVLMSAGKDDEIRSSANGRIHTFHQNVPTPSYLIAIVCGKLESRDISNRVRVWSEHELVDKAAREFEDTERMLQIAEKLLGPYVWGRYDLLVLPPSFPFGGMENPCLSFLTPTLLAGDKSLANVVAHELSHSWTGNLVSNSNWEHFWLKNEFGHENVLLGTGLEANAYMVEALRALGLNEGFTVFLERKILGRLENDLTLHLAAVTGWQTLEQEVARQGAEHPFTCLVPNLKDVDPDDAYSYIPYEKGSAFLFYLQQKLGGPEIFEPYVREYLSKFERKSLTTSEWRDHLYGYFHGKVEQAVLDGVDWQGWMYTPGMPPNKPEFNYALADAYQALARRWIEADATTLDHFCPGDIASFNTLQMEGLITTLMQSDALPIDKIKKMDEVYKFSQKMNCEIRLRWLRLGIKARYEAVVDSALDFINSQGRMKYTRPIYRDLYAWELTREKVTDNFKKERPNMHAIAAGQIAKDLHLTD